MTDHELNHILSREQDLVPSSGFVSSVMDALRMEAAAPPPLQLPWQRWLPGLLAWALAFGAIAWLSLDGSARYPLAPPDFQSTLAAFWQASTRVGAGWAALALFLAFTSAALSMRFVKLFR